jgi:POT family proton-dependent oligopeptide transporter
MAANPSSSVPTASVPRTSVAPAALDRGFFGHPRGLRTLFFTEMWERFSYYGMRALLTPFMTATVVAGGLGMNAEQSGAIYATYTALVYLTCLPGGWLADNYLGQRRSVLYGGTVIMTGHILLSLQGLACFYAGLACVIFGTGMLKPNISAIVGQLYDQKDNRRDSGFSIFYMGINIGAFLAPQVCAYLAQEEPFKSRLTGWGLDPTHSWHWGFGAAAVGMFFGLVQYVLTGRNLGEAGLRPAVPKNAEVAARNRRTLRIGLIGLVLAIGSIVTLAATKPEVLTQETIHTATFWLLLVISVAFFVRLFTGGDWTKAERARLVLIFVLFCGAAVFWGVFEQAGSTLSLFAERNTDNQVKVFNWSWSFGSARWQSLNAILIVILAPFFSWLWIALGNRNPSYPTKFAIGILFAGLGFLWLVPGAKMAADGTKVGVIWLFGVYLLHTIGELCLSPVGLSSMTKLAPQRVVGLMMGVWFLAASIGNFVGGSVSRLYEDLATDKLLLYVALSAFVMAGVMFALGRPIRNMLAASEAGGDGTASGH